MEESLTTRAMPSPQSREILRLISEGHSYEQILHKHPELTYHDIFRAAAEALAALDQAPQSHTPAAPPAPAPPPPTTLADILRYLYATEGGYDQQSIDEMMRGTDEADHLRVIAEFHSYHHTRLELDTCHLIREHLAHLGLDLPHGPAPNQR